MAREPERHRWLDAFMGVGSGKLREVVEAITGHVERHEQENGYRARARRAIDLLRFRTASEVVVSNLAHAVLLPPETGRLAVTTGNALKGHSRYQNPALGKTLRDILWRMQEIGYLDLQRPSVMRGEASSIAPTDKLKAMVLNAGIGLDDFTRIAGEETVILSLKASSRAEVDYDDTPQTIAMRTDMEALNSFLAEADLTFIDDGLGPVDLSQATMRRHFRAHSREDRSFDKGGRLFGGWWQNLKSGRRAGIRIADEGTAVLDYSSMFPRLAYAKVGATPPEGDLYAIPGLEDHRRAVKLALNCFLFDTNRHRSKWPDELTNPEPGTSPDAIMPREWTVARVRAAILERHPALTDVLGQGIGLHLMYQESVILVEVLRELRGRGIVGLGLHDGLIVTGCKAAEVRMVMMEAALQATSMVFPVTMETLS